MHPWLDLFGHQVSTYSLAYLVAALLAGTWSLRRLLEIGVPARFASELLLSAGAAGVVGAVVTAKIIRLLAVDSPPAGAATSLGGSTIFGFFGLGGAVGLTYCRWRHIVVGAAGDQIAIPFSLALAIGRIGCLARGCCHGRPTDSWLGVELPDANGLWAMRYPTQAISALADLVIFVLLLVPERVRQQRRARSSVVPGQGLLAIVFGGAYATKRLLLAAWRDEAPMIGASWSWSEAFALVQLVVAVLLLGRAVATEPAARASG